MKKIFLILLMLMVLAPTVYAAFVMQRSYRHYEGLSTDTLPTALTAAQVGFTAHEADTGVSYLWTGTTWMIDSPNIATTVADTTSINAIGTSDAIATVGYNLGGYYFTLVNIDTDMTIDLEVRAGDSAWTSAGDQTTTYTTDGDYGLLSGSIAAADSMRLNWSAEDASGASISSVTPVLAKE